MNKRVFGVLGVVVAVGVSVLVWKGVIPPKQGLEGSIGVANRYQTDQLASADVALDPTVLNDLLQSDVVHRLAKDPEFKKTVMSEAFKSVVVQGEFQRLMKDNDFRSLIQRPDFAKLAASGELEKVNLVLEAEKAKLAASELDRSDKVAEYGKTVKSAEELNKAKRLETDLDKATKVTTDLDKATKVATDLDKATKVATDLDKAAKLQNIDWAKAGLSKEYEAVTKCPEFNKLIATNLDFAKLIKGQDLGKALAVSPEVGKMLSTGDVQRFVTTEQGSKALVSDDFLKKAVQSSGD